MQYNRFLPLLVPLLSYALMQVYYFKPNLIYVSLVMQCLLFFFTARQFIIISYKQERWWNLFILPSCFTVGLMAFTTLVPDRSVIQVLFLVNAVFLYFYFRTIYYYLIKTDSYNQYHLENLASYGNFLAFYLIASSVYGLEAFLNIPNWIMILALGFFTALNIYQVMWANRIDGKITLFYVLIITLVIVEAAWAIYFLTLSYYVLGLLLSICYYVIIGLARFQLINKLDQRIVRMYLILGLLSIIAVLLTSRWL